MQVLMVADDLTGALDSAVMFANAGLRCIVARRPADVAAALDGSPDVLAVSTASREGSEAAAVLAIDAVFDALEGAIPLIFKKVDSRLKGHVAAELAAAARRSGIGRALAAPALPAQGRIATAGQLLGSGIAAPIDIAGRFEGSGVALDIPGTASDADLDAALARVLGGGPTLLVGAAGLAAALARRIGLGALPPPTPLPPLLLTIGSRDPITLAQVDQLTGGGLVDLVAAPNGCLPELPPLRAAAALVQLVPGATEVAPEVAGAQFAASAAALLETRAVRTLFACGGETADAILGLLGVRTLAVEGELLPGVPVSRMLVNGRPMHLISKSGGFGGADTLRSVVERVRDVKGNGRQ